MADRRPRLNDTAIARRLRADADAWRMSPSRERQDRIMRAIAEAPTTLPFPENVAHASVRRLAVAAIVLLAAGAGFWAVMSGLGGNPGATEAPRQVAVAESIGSTPSGAAESTPNVESLLTLAERAFRETSMHTELAAFETDVRHLSSTLRRRATMATMGLLD